MSPKWKVFAAVGGGLALLAAAATRRSRAVVAYSATGSDVGEFARVADAIAAALRAAGWQTAVVAAYDRAALAAALQSQKPVAKLVLVGHGTSTRFMTGALDLTPPDLASMLAPTVAARVTIGLAGCRAGADTSEPDWGPSAYGPGGAASFAGRLRDALVALHTTGAVRAHSSTGGAAANPSGRLFPIEASQAGRPGLAAQGSTPRQTWLELFRGGYGDRWMAGV